MIYILLNTPLLLVLFPILIGVFKWSVLSPSFRILFYYSAYTASLEWILYVFGVFGIENLFLLHFAVPVEFTFIVLFWLYQGSIKRFKYVVYLLLAILLLTSVYETIYINSWDAIPAASLVLSSTFILMMVFMYYYESLRFPDPTPIGKQPVFYLSTAFLVYFGFSIFYFMLYNIINKEFNELIGSVWHSLVNCIYYILLSASFLCIPKAKTI